MVLGVFSSMRKRIRRGDIWFINTPEGIGCEQQGDRVALVISPDICQEKSDNVIVLLGTKQEKKVDLQTQFVVNTDWGLKYDTVFMAEQIKSVDRQRFMMYCTHLDNFKMQEAHKAMCVAQGLLEPINNKYIKLLIDYINMLDQELITYQSASVQKLREEKIIELKEYCEEYRYDYRVFLERYLLFKEVENIERIYS
jgi:mRNA interferase MazF